MGKWFLLFRSGGMGAVLVVLLATAGCVSPETATKIDALTKRVDEVVAKHTAGELTTKEATAQLKPLLEEMKAVKDAEGSWWEKALYVLGSVLSVAVFRKIGLPWLASGSKPILTVNNK